MGRGDAQHGEVLLGDLFCVAQMEEVFSRALLEGFQLLKLIQGIGAVRRRHAGECAFVEDGRETPDVVDMVQPHVQLAGFRPEHGSDLRFQGAEAVFLPGLEFFDVLFDGPVDGRQVDPRLGIASGELPHGAQTGLIERVVQLPGLVLLRQKIVDVPGRGFDLPFENAALFL